MYISVSTPNTHICLYLYHNNYRTLFILSIYVSNYLSIYWSAINFKKAETFYFHLLAQTIHQREGSETRVTGENPRRQAAENAVILKPDNTQTHQKSNLLSTTDGRQLAGKGDTWCNKGSKPEVLSRIAQTTAAMTKLKAISNDKNIAISSKIRLMRSLTMSIFLYACESWTITADIERRIQALEMRCFRILLGISYRDHITNEEVKARIRNAIGQYEDLLTAVKRHKLKWYGLVTRSSGLTMTILQGTVQGGRQRGRQRKQWEDNIKKWTGLEWNIILRKAENREEWKKLVVKSTGVPQRSARLRDR